MAKREVRGEDLQIGQMLQHARKEKEVLQDDIAEATGLSKNHICDIECGRSKGSIHLLLGYCNKLGMTPNEILGFDEKESNVIPKLRNTIERLSPEDQERLLKIINLTFQK